MYAIPPERHRASGMTCWGRIYVQTREELLNKRIENKARKKKKVKKNARIICRSGTQFWTTQAQFWQWVREGIVVKSHDGPLTGSLVRENEEVMVVLQNTILSLAHPNHLHEALKARRIGLPAR